MRKIYSALLLLFFVSKTFAQNYTVLGNASSLGGCNCFRLTPDADDQAGAIFQNQTINLNNSFDFTFNVFLGCNGSNGADGIVFVLTSNPNGLGNQGEGLGYAGSNQPFSLAVEFDTWQNGSVSDPPFDHIGIESGGLYSHNVAAPVSALTSQGNIDNCQWHTVRIVWDVNTGTYTVYFDGVLRQQIVVPNLVNAYFGGNPVVNWGWSGATGGGSNDQQVCVLNTSNWVAGTNYQSCNTTMQFQDISTSSLGSVSSWAWTFGDGGTSSSQNPSHTYAGTGTYNVTLVITDLSGCTNTYTHTVTINPPISMAPTITPPLCNGGLNGGISIAPSGGFGPAAGYGGYMYNWSNTTTQSTLVGAGAGTYTLTVTDGVCTSTAQYTISQPTAVTATTAHTDAPCGSNGTATITVSGGTPPYSGVNWAGFPATSGVPLSMPSGTWIADFHDANGCSALLQYRETISSLPCGITTSLTSTNVSCFGGSNGTASLTVTGGSGGNVPGWTTVGGGVFTITGLAGGTYNYNYTDANPALNFSFTVIITQPGAAISATLATVDMSCANTNDGQALASVSSGGTAPFGYAWSRGTPNGAITTGLSPGPISVVITDINGCTATASGTITGPPTLTLNVTSVDDSCYQAHLGSATANAGGGNPPYLYFWSNISSAQTNLSLGIGSYTVTVTDNKGCTITGSANINQPPPFSHTITSTNILCNGSANGTITVTPSGGVPAYTYTWNNGVTPISNPTGLAAGQYNVTISDSHNCQRLDSVVITEPPVFTVTTSHTNVTCFGANDGTLTVTISGGTPPYSFGGFPVPPGTTTLPGLPDSTYAGNILDAHGCSVAVSETITEPAQLVLTETHTNVTCNGGNNGSIDITVTGGNPPYTYLWNDAANTEDRTNMPAGLYILQCPVGTTCSASISVTISQPASLSITETHVNVLCNGGNTGSIDITVTGGTSPYSYLWNDGVTTEDRTNIVAGCYTVTSTDNNGCTISLTICITEPTALVVTSSHTNVTCFGANNGTLTINVGGGTAPYNFGGIPVPAGTTTIPGLPDSTYAGNIADANGCSVPVSETITEPTLLSLSETHINATCNGASNASIDVTVTGGTSPYTFLWNNGVTTEDRTAITAGTDTLVCTDANLCTATIVVTVTEPAAPSMTVTAVDAICFGGNGSATANPSGGGPFTYTWSSGGGNNQTTTPPAGNYTVSAADANSCNQTASFTINQPTQIITGETHVNPVCFGDATGKIFITANGGTPGYTYTWTSAVSTVDSAVNLVAATYNVTVTDVNACTAVQTAIITQPAQLALSSTVIDVLCNGSSTGSITATATGGTAAYNFSASDGTNTFNSTTGQFTSLAAGNYSITVTDQNTCSVTTSAVINEPLPLADIIDTFPVLCIHNNNGRIVVSVSGGTSPYNISLSNGQSNAAGTFTGLSAGTYNVSVTDANGCALTDVAVITEPDSVLVSISPSPVQVNLGDALQLTTTTNQGGILTYLWTPAAGLSCNDCANPMFDGVYSQPYSLIVTNQDGCRGTAQFVVTVIPNYDIFIPNAFTPNGDGTNDSWEIFGNMNAIKQLQIAVFNRWGEKVYDTNDIHFKWDGTYRGEKVPPGVYVYTAKFVWLNNHADTDYTGSISVLH